MEKTNLVGFMVGQIIKSSGGSKVNPGIAKEILS